MQNTITEYIRIYEHNLATPYGRRGARLRIRLPRLSVNQVVDWANQNGHNWYNLNGWVYDRNATWADGTQMNEPIWRTESGRGLIDLIRSL